MFAFILDTLGSTELIFILLIALIFFGPRKLPQLARSMGKGLSEFRKASDDFKRTWEREVALETARADDNSISDTERVTYEGPENFDEPIVEPPDSDLVVPRENLPEVTPEALPEPMEIPKVPTETTSAQPVPVRKQDWL